MQSAARDAAHVSLYQIIVVLCIMFLKSCSWYQMFLISILVLDINVILKIILLISMLVLTINVILDIIFSISMLVLNINVILNIIFLISMLLLDINVILNIMFCIATSISWPDGTSSNGEVVCTAISYTTQSSSQNSDRCGISLTFRQHQHHRKRAFRREPKVPPTITSLL